MQEQELINISVESNIKMMAEAIFEQFGMTKNEAIELFGSPVLGGIISLAKKKI